MPLRPPTALALVPLLLGACSSQPLATSGAGATGGSAGGPGTGGTSGGGGGTGARGGSAGTLDIPDYTTSPCYGESSRTLVYDLLTHDTREVTATCRAEGSFARVYVADELWQTQTDPAETPLDQNEIDAFMAGYELRGRAGSYRPDLGVLPTDELVFGSLTAATLTEGKLPIFIIDSGGAGEGYLCSWCADTELHLDYPLLGSLHSDRTLSIAAHESFHAIHHGYDPDESFWVDESLAEAAMTVNGFYTDGAWVGSFLHDTNVAWGPTLSNARDFNYGAGLLFGTFLWEHGGADLLYAITHDPKHEWDGIDSALASVGDTASSWQLWGDLGLALFLDDPASGYAFTSFELAGQTLPYVAKTGATLSETLAPYGFVFVTFGADARRLVFSSDGDVTARLVFDGSPADVRELANGDSLELDSTPRVLMLTAKQSTPFDLVVE